MRNTFEHKLSFSLIATSSKKIFHILSVCFWIVATMHFFKSLRKFYERMGIYPPHSHTNPFNLKILFFFWYIALVSTSTLSYFLFEAKSLQDYGKAQMNLKLLTILSMQWKQIIIIVIVSGVCFYGVVTFYTYMAYILIAVWRRPNVFMLLTEFERLTEKSK